jgi:hypothetical protein
LFGKDIKIVLNRKKNLADASRGKAARRSCHALTFPGRGNTALFLQMNPENTSAKQNCHHKNSGNYQGFPSLFSHKI